MRPDYKLTPLQVWILQRVRDGALLDPICRTMNVTENRGTSITGVLYALPRRIGLTFLEERRLLYRYHGFFALTEYGVTPANEQPDLAMAEVWPHPGLVPHYANYWHR